MPYNHTHALFALRVLDRVNGALQRLVQPHRDAYLIGALGPDPYFGDGLLPTPFVASAVCLAECQHTAGAQGLLRAFVQEAAGDAYCGAYTLGYLCHFLLDTHAHPYIMARFPGALHTLAEIRMDLRMAALLADRRAVVPPNRLFRTDRLHDLDVLHTAVNRTAFGIERPHVFARSFHKWIAVNTVTFDASGRKTAFMRRIGALSRYFVNEAPDGGRDDLNERCLPWQAKADGAVRTESFPMLFEAAERAGAALLPLAAEALLTGEDAALLHAIGRRNMDAAEFV